MLAGLAGDCHVPSGAFCWPEPLISGGTRRAAASASASQDVCMLGGGRRGSSKHSPAPAPAQGGGPSMFCGVSCPLPVSSPRRSRSLWDMGGHIHFSGFVQVCDPLGNAEVTDLVVLQGQPPVRLHASTALFLCRLYIGLVV